MAGSVLGYRVFRLRRLIVVCLGLVALAVFAGMWLVPGQTALQVVIGIGLFSIFAVAQLAMILLWPRDAVGPLTYATGLLPTLVIGLPMAAKLVADPETQGVFMVLTVMFGPFVWLTGVPLLGWLILKPLDLIKRRSVTIHARSFLPLPLDVARTAFFAKPGKQGSGVVCGQIGWDGSFSETVTQRVAGPASGQISAQVVVNRLRILEEDGLSQGVIVTMPPPDGAVGAGVSIVMRQALAPQGNGTEIDRQYHIEEVPLAALVTGWLADVQGDSITAVVDDALGHPPRAIMHEPSDTMWQSLSRWLRWNEPGAL
jgi:hypothetical protein